MGRESRVWRARHIEADDSITYATAEELKADAALVERAKKAGLVLPTIQSGANFKLVRLKDDS